LRGATQQAAIASSVNELSGDVACDNECLGDCPPLRDEAGEFIRRGEKQPFRQFLHAYSDC
jgi:hypothetical protein